MPAKAEMHLTLVQEGKSVNAEILINKCRDIDTFLSLFSSKKKSFNKGWRSNSPLLIRGIQEQDFTGSVKCQWQKADFAPMLGDDKLKVENWAEFLEEGHFFLRKDTHKDGEKYVFVTNIISSETVFTREAGIAMETAIL